MLVVVSFTSGLGLSVLITNKVLIEPISLLTSLHFLSRQRWLSTFSLHPSCFQLKTKAHATITVLAQGMLNSSSSHFGKLLAPSLPWVVLDSHLLACGTCGTPSRWHKLASAISSFNFACFIYTQLAPNSLKFFRQTHTCYVAPLCVHYTDKCYIIF